MNNQVVSEASGAAEKEKEDRRYQLLRDGEVVEVGIEKLIALAEKGLGYDRMKEMFDQMQEERRRMEIEAEDLRELFPDADPKEVAGNPMAAAYLKKGYSLAAAQAMRLAEEARIRRINEETTKRSTGDIGAAAVKEEQYSEEQIGGMSVEEIKEHFPQIIKRFRKNNKN